MRQNITELWGHTFALLFTALLLLVGMNFFQRQPILSAALLLLFALIYGVAAFFSRRMLAAYPSILLLVVVYNLVLYGLGVQLVVLPLASSGLTFVFILLAKWFDQKNLPFMARALSGSALLLVVVLAVLTLLQVGSLTPFGFFTASLTFSALALSFTLRSLLEHRTWHQWGFSLLAVPAFLFMLHSNVLYAEYFAATVIAVVALWNVARNAMVAESLLATAIAACFGIAAYFKAPAATMPVAYAAGAISLVWFYLSLYRRLQDVIPALAAAWLLTLIPLALTFPWNDAGAVFALMSLVACLYLLAGTILLKRAHGMFDLVFGHAHVAVGELAAVVPLVYAGLRDLPPTYNSAALTLLVAGVATLAGLANQPMVFKVRRHFFYWAGLFVTISFLIALWRPNPIWNAPANLWLALLFLVLLYGIAEGFAKVDRAGYETILEVPGIAVALIGAVYIVNRPQGGSLDLLLPAGLALPGLLFYGRSKQSPALTSSIVAAVVLLLALLTSAGLASIGGSIVFLLLAIGLMAWEVKSGVTRWSYLRFVALGAVSLATVGLSFPWGSPGVFVLAALPVAYLVAATFAHDRRRVRMGLEVTSYALMLFTALVVAVQGMALPAAILATVYACAFFFAMARHRQAFYLYPAGVFAILAAFLFAWIAGRGALYVLLAFPLTLIFHGVGTRIKSAQLGDWRAKAVRPLYLGGHLNAALGAIAFVLLTPNLGDLPALAGVTLNLILYAWMVSRRQEQTFLAGMGVAASLFVLIVLSFLPFVQRANLIGYFTPVILVLLLAGWLLKRDDEQPASWAMLSTVTVLTLVVGGVALWGEGLDPASVWVALLISSAVWLSLLLLTRLDVFIYLITASLALLSYNFVRATGDTFTPHVLIFLVYGCALIALIFVYDLVSRRMRFRAPIHFGRAILRRDWVLYGIPAVVLAGVAFAAFGVESTSTPTFCNLCHTMNPYYANWQTSVHARAGVGCADCHYEPTAQSFVKNKIVGLSEVVKVATGTENEMVMAVVNDSSCLRGGCHTTTALKSAPITLASGVSFSHANHLERTVRGLQVTCTVCHTMTRADQHFTVNPEACFLCHLKPGQSASVGADQCVTCHSLKAMPTSSGFSHETLIAANCVSCHAGVTAGDGRVKRECSTCHLEDSEQLLRQAPSKIHQLHVTEKGLHCERCHEALRHGAGSAVSLATTPEPAVSQKAPGTVPKLPADHSGRTQCLICHSTGIGGAPQAPAKNPDHAIFKDDNSASLCLMCHARP